MIVAGCRSLLLPDVHSTNDCFVWISFVGKLLSGTMPWKAEDPLCGKDTLVLLFYIYITLSSRCRSFLSFSSRFWLFAIQLINQFQCFARTLGANNPLNVTRHYEITLKLQSILIQSNGTILMRASTSIEIQSYFPVNLPIISVKQLTWPDLAYPQNQVCLYRCHQDSVALVSFQPVKSYFMDMAYDLMSLHLLTVSSNPFYVYYK